jgi:hypothetical protein
MPDRHDFREGGASDPKSVGIAAARRSCFVCDRYRAAHPQRREPYCALVGAALPAAFTCGRWVRADGARQ